MLLELTATLCAGLFGGAAIYVSLVEHPARLECGTALAISEFGRATAGRPSCKRPSPRWDSWPPLEPGSRAGGSCCSSQGCCWGW